MCLVCSYERGGLAVVVVSVSGRRGPGTAFGEPRPLRSVAAAE